MNQMDTDFNQYKFPVAFASHGGGPWPIIHLDGFDDSERLSLLNYMKSISDIPKQKPRALLVLSAHWEQTEFTINSNSDPKLLFDYYGFPEEAYKFLWPASNDLSLCEEIAETIKSAGIEISGDQTRDYDHGVFIPLLIAYPEIDIPVIQLSLKRGLDPFDHIRVGEALEPLRNKGIFIVGSGNSYHNVGKMFNPTPDAITASEEFDKWLKKILSLDSKSRKKELINWKTAPSARTCHPREEHLIPLMVAVGAAGNSPTQVSWTGTVNGTFNTAFHFD